MAQIDTGLGWSAKSEWLFQSGGIEIGTMREAGGQYYQGQPLPYAATNEEGALVGYYICNYQTAYVSNRSFYAFTKTQNADCFYAIYRVGNGYGAIGISTTQNADIWVVRKITSSGAVQREGNGQASSFDSTTGLYYSTNIAAINLANAVDTNPNLHVFNDMRDALDSVAISIN